MYRVYIMDGMFNVSKDGQKVACFKSMVRLAEYLTLMSV